MSDDEYEPHTDYEIEPDTFPAELLTLDRWFVWALDDGRKIPRAPWANPDHMDRYVSWKDRENWVDFETADEWVEKVDRFGHASCIPAFEDNTEERLLFFDFDDCRDPETGEIHGQAWGFIEKYGLSAYLSTSGTGVHAFGWGSLPEGYKPSFEIALPEWDYDDEPHLEVYASARFMALTGEHIAGTPVSVPDLDDLAHELFESKGTERTTGTEREPDVSREELADVETTTDLDDIYDAIAHVRPRDIRLRSPVTEEYSGRDANCARDPSWANSESGTRLAEFDDHWLYRKGNHNLDALQVVALEERILRDESDYPEGDEFVEAVDALRERGAHIPELQTERTTSFDVTSDDDTDAESATDGGTTTAEGDSAGGPETSFEAFADRVRDAIRVYEAGDINKATARQRITDALMDGFDFVYPEEEVFGWAHRLYVYEPDEGIYEPRGVDFIERQLERAGGDFVTNNLVREIVGKVERRSKKRNTAFNTAPERLVVDNGILDLHTGELDPHTALEYHRSKIDVAWNPDAGEPDAIDEFFHDIVDDSDVETLYRLVAHTLYKDYIGNKAAMLIGSGANGKSMFLSLIEELLGEFNVTRRELHDFSGDDYALNNLAGKLANLATEIGDKEMNDTTAFKKATGGDNITAQVKHESPIDFKNYATMMFATNEMPVFAQDNHAIWRRWLYVEFPYTFDADKPEAKDPVPERVLEQRLFRDEELQALLVRCQQEIERWWNGEDLFADAMPAEDVRAKMKQAAEPVFAFANACLEAAEEDEWVEKSVVREAYKTFASEEDLPRIPDNEFGSRLLSLRDYQIEAENGKRHQGNRYNVYSGIQLSSRGRQVLGVDEPDDGQGTVDGEYEQATAAVLNHIQELVDDSGGEPVPAEAIVWSVPDLGKAEAASALEELKSSGRVYDSGDGILPT